MPVSELQGEMDLIDRARSGSVDAFEQLVIHYQDRLYRFLLLRARNPMDAQDALQEAFVAAFKYLPGYRSHYRFSTWLFTIGLRKLGKLSQGQPGRQDLPETIVCTLPGPENIEMQMQNRKSLWDTAKACLSEAQCTALWLFYVEDMSLAEISSAMKRSLNWVKVNLLRARRRLSRELQEDHFDGVVPAREVTQ